MGGERADVIETGAKSKKGQPVDVNAGQSIRIHENQGEVHFHVDAEKLKCAVPVPVFWKAWDRLSSNAETFSYVDTTNKSVLTIRTTLVEENGGKSHSINAGLTVSRLTETNEIYQKLEKFSKG